MSYPLYGALGRYDFPKQRVDKSEREKPEWYMNCIDFIISQGQSVRNANSSIEEGFNIIEEQYNALHGNISTEFYKKILNPYNAKDDKFKRFPATMRNYDMLRGIIRRYCGEYSKNPHDFLVGANNPEVVLAKDAKLKEKIMKLAEHEIAKRIQQAYQEFVNEGNPPEQFNPKESIDVEKVIKEFNENYIDEISAQAGEIFEVIKDVTEDVSIYIQAYFEWVSFGECYTYTDVVGNKLIKRCVSVRDAFPVPNDSMFVEDYDMFAERRKLSYQQIIDEYDEYLSDKDKEFLHDYYGRKNITGDYNNLSWRQFKNYNADQCNKFSQEERNLFRDDFIMARDMNGGLYDVWHVVWRGERKQGILTYQENGFITTRVVDEDYVLKPELGDIDIEWQWIPQVYEGVRIGTRYSGIYPYKSRAICYERNGKLPYNGLMELIPGFGKFSIINLVLPYQIFGNIVHYHREMAIAKNKLNVLLIAKSLLGKYPEETIYRMAADGTLIIDDEDDTGMLRAQQVRMLNSQMNDYINQLTNLIEANKQQAMDVVDMTPQRYGDIANSAGKGVTNEAIIRGSMGSVIVELVFDLMRERDYNRDLDFSKLAWIDGLSTSYRGTDKSIKYMSLNVENHIYADYVIKAKLSAKEMEKLQQYKQFAFSAAQNGDNAMAAIAIEGDTSSEIKRSIIELQKAKEEHEQAMQQMEMENNKMLQEFELQKISAKGEEDRKTLELEKYLDGEIESLKGSLNILSFNNNISEQTKQQAEARIAEADRNLEQQKINLDREKMYVEARNKDKELAAKKYDSDIKLKIAKQNKNKYDKK